MIFFEGFDGRMENFLWADVIIPHFLQEPLSFTQNIPVGQPVCRIESPDINPLAIGKNHQDHRKRVISALCCRPHDENTLILTKGYKEGCIRHNR